METKHSPLLSICINTMNRADLLIESINSIIPFMNQDVEVIIFDGSNKEEELQKTEIFASRYNSIQHIKSPKPTGIDEGYDLSVEYASGKYCWLLPDDDPIFLDRIQKLLNALNKDYDLILVNLECWTKELTSNLQQPLFTVEEDIEFDGNKGVTFWKTIGVPISYIGSIIIKRDIWRSVNKKESYGSYFSHATVIMNSKRIHKVLVLAEPIIKYRSGNSSWTARSFEIWNFLWPNLLWGNPNLTTNEKRAIVPKLPWKRKRSMIKSRAMGELNYDIYKVHLKENLSIFERPLYMIISVLPSGILNYMILGILVLFLRKRKYSIYNLAITNPNYFHLKKLLKKIAIEV